jgi:hypothetical protein
MPGAPIPYFRGFTAFSSGLLLNQQRPVADGLLLQQQ